MGRWLVAADRLGGLLTVALANAARPGRRLPRQARGHALRSTASRLLLSMLVVVPVASPAASAAEDPVLVADLDPRGAGSHPQGLMRAGGRVFFTASDGEHGRELWATDGSRAGTRLVHDFVPGPRSGDPRLSAAAGSDVYYIVSRRGSETLWRSDGTPSGTRKLMKLSDRANTWPKAAGSRVYFQGWDATHGVELWVSDGTRAGTRIVKDIRPGRGGNVYLDETAAIGDAFFFVADDGLFGREVWRSDGTAAGTTRVSDVGDADILELQAVGDRLFFTERNTGRLWTSDGTTEGTRLLMEVSEGSGPWRLTGAGGLLYFQVQREDNTSVLWSSDGTEAGTRPVRTFDALVLDYLGSAGTSLIAVSVRETRGGRRIRETELWRSDGTEEGTRMLRTFDGPPSAGAQVGDRLFFVADDRTHGREPWVTDGTAEGTRLVRDLSPGRRGSQGGDDWDGAALAALEGRVIFAAGVRAHGDELWRSDGTPEGTSLVRDIRPGGASSGISELAAAGDRVYFVSDLAGSQGFEVWRTDGSRRGTRRLMGGLVGTAGNAPYGFSPLDRRMLFFNSDDSGMTLYASDGTKEGTRWLQGFSNAAEPWCTGGSALLRGDLFVACSKGLLRTDGSRAGSGFINRLAGSDCCDPHVWNLVKVGGQLYFTVARWGYKGDRFVRKSAELWQSRGTKATTRRVLTLDFGPSAGLLAVGDRLYTMARDPGHGLEPWISDGTAGGTRRLADVRRGPAGSWPRSLSPFGGGAYFSADDGVHGREPWITDDGGTRLLTDVRPGGRGSEPGPAVALATGYVFVADDGRHGRELWFSDGTQVGTRLVHDIAGGRAHADPAGLTRVGDVVYFAATDRWGRELWRSDGTLAGTRRVVNLRPGRRGSNPGPLLRAGDDLYFVADDGRHGRELWRLVP